MNTSSSRIGVIMLAFVAVVVKMRAVFNASEAFKMAFSADYLIA